MKQTAHQRDLTWLHDDPDRYKTLPCLYTEYMLRVQAGQHPEIWDTLGGADSETSMWGVTLLWIPEESVLWAFNCGLDPTWYYSPLTRDALLSELAEPGEYHGSWFGWCSELKYYRAWSAACRTCGVFLTPDEWTTALYVAEGEPDSPQCDTCREAEFEACRIEQGL